MTKEEFVEKINRLIEFEDYINKLGDLNVNIWERDEYSYFYDSYVDMIVNLIGEENRDLILFFIYDLDCGRSYEPGCLTVGDKDIDLSTPEKVYDIIPLKKGE